MTEIISHPGKLLVFHLREVADFCAETIESKSLGLDIPKDVLSKLAFIQGSVHDIGKATKNFQTYIRSEGKIVIRPKHHALISAFLAKSIVTEFLKDTNLSKFDKELLPYFIFTSVKRHHGNVLNFDFELKTIGNKKDDLKILTINFYDDEVQMILDELLGGIGITYDWQSFKSVSYTHLTLPTKT